MFNNAQQAMEWLRERGYPTLQQVYFSDPPWHRKWSEWVLEWALLVKAEPGSGLPLHIYWLRVTPGCGFLKHIVEWFVNKYPHFYSLFIVAKASLCELGIVYPDPEDQNKLHTRTAVLSASNTRLMEALRYDPEIPLEKQW